MHDDSDVYTGENCRCSYCLVPFFRTQLILVVKGKDGKDYTFCNHTVIPKEPFQVNVDFGACIRRFDIQSVIKKRDVNVNHPTLMYFHEAPGDATERARDPYAGMNWFQRLFSPVDF